MTTRRLPDALLKEWTLPPASTAVHSRQCVHCRVRPASGQSAYCGGSCRRMNNRMKWQSASGAVWTRAREWTDVLPSPAKVDELFEWFKDTRYPERLEQRARLMVVFQLHWNSGERRWERI